MNSVFIILILSVVLSVGRNILSKKNATDSQSTGDFFLTQALLFASGTALQLLFNTLPISKISFEALIFGIIYGVLLILAQWMFAFALKNGNTAICSVIYSLGFIFPTLSGALFWSEPFTAVNFAGLILALFVIFLNVKSNSKAKQNNKSFVSLALIAMLASGGLGVMQKVQQSGKYADQKSLFLSVAFALAFTFSLLATLHFKEPKKLKPNNIIFSLSTGLCFSGANLCNTFLAGKMKSAVFFPVQNIGTILLTAVLGICIFGDKLTPKAVLTIVLAIIVVLIFSIGK